MSQRGKRILLDCNLPIPTPLWDWLEERLDRELPDAYDFTRFTKDELRAQLWRNAGSVKFPMWELIVDVLAKMSNKDRDSILEGLPGYPDRVAPYYELKRKISDLELALGTRAFDAQSRLSEAMAYSSAVRALEYIVGASKLRGSEWDKEYVVSLVESALATLKGIKP